MRDDNTADGDGGLGMPTNPSLPIFVYGTLMKGQPGYHQIELFKPEVTLADVSGQLYVRDGLPLLKIVDYATTSGQLLRFPADQRDKAIRVICNFEPKTQYQWREVWTSPPVLLANALIGLHLDKGHPEELEAEGWSIELDPIFSDALSVVREVANFHGAASFPASPGQEVDFKRGFYIQMAYLLLWSVLERYSALAIGPSQNPNRRVTLMGKLAPVVDAISSLCPLENRVLFDSRNPRETFRLDTINKPEKAMNYYYAIRSNMSHRGKGAWYDAEVVRLSLLELLAVTEKVLGNYRREM